MHGRNRALTVASATLVACLSGGVAWAASGGLSPHSSVHAADVTESSTASTSSTDTSSTMFVDTTSTSESTSTTSTTETTETTTTTATTTTTVPESTTTAGPNSRDAQGCKPGWGYGDKNHCHSGPPGLNKSHAPKHP